MAPPTAAGLAVRMQIEQADLADAKKIRECYEVYLAAQRVDEPEEPWFTDRPFSGWLTVGWNGNPREVWLATDQGSAAGWYRLETADQENLDQANLDLVVHPAERRHGLGLALLQHAAARAAARERSVLNGATRDGSAGEAFARSVGAKPGLVEVQRVLDIGQLEKGKLARLRGTTYGRRPAIRWRHGPGRYPTSSSSSAAAVYNAMNDAPRDPEIAHRGMERAASTRTHQRPAPALRAA